MSHAVSHAARAPYGESCVWFVLGKTARKTRKRHHNKALPPHLEEGGEEGKTETEAAEREDVDGGGVVILNVTTMLFMTETERQLLKHVG